MVRRGSRARRDGLDQAYLEYVENTDYPDGIEEYVKAGAKALVLRTFSKIYGLAGLRVGYGVGPAELITAIGKVRRAFDVRAGPGGGAGQPGRRRRARRRRAENAPTARSSSGRAARPGPRPVGPAVGNFVFAEVGADARPLFEALLREGVIVRRRAGSVRRPIRVSVGTAEENAIFADALGRVIAETSVTPAG